MKYQHKWAILSLLVLGAALICHGSASAQTKGSGHAASQASSSAGATLLPMWQYSITSTVDGNSYNGYMVGRSPFYHGARTTSIPTYVVPIIVTLPNQTGVGTTTFDPTVADSTCLGGSVPLTLFQQSPLVLGTTSFSFGPTNVGTTQYTDAFQRGNFWNSPANVAATGNSYHTVLNPVTTLPAQTVTIPTGFGQAYQSSAFGGSAGCGSFGVADYTTLNTILAGTVLPTLVASNGVTPASLVVFLTYNLVEAYPGEQVAGKCCSLGFHAASAAGVISPTSPAQTYVAADFDSTGLFGSADVASISHQLGAWMVDPLNTQFNLVPAWTPPAGNVGVCQNALDPGYPLLGVLVQPGAAASSSNSVQSGAATFTYDLQELAFYSWFYRQDPSLGVNGWFSTNNTLVTDASAVCGS